MSCARTGRVSTSPATSFLPPSRELRTSTTRSSGKTSTLTPIRILRPVAEAPRERGLIDTSVVIGIDEVDPARLPAEISISSLTLAELTAGPHAVADEMERARRQHRLQRFETGVEAVPFDSACARAYGPVYVAVVSMGRKARGSRAVDLMIAATALAYDLPLYTLNAKDLHGLEDLIEIVDAGA